MDKFDVKGAIVKLQNRIDALDGKSLQAKDWVNEILVHVLLLERICSQQQEEIDTLKRSKNVR